jgi:hypothetical protein
MKQQNHQWALWALSGGKWGVSCLSHLSHKAEKEKKRKKNTRDYIWAIHLGITLEYKYENLILSCLHPTPASHLSSLSLAAATLLSHTAEQLSISSRSSQLLSLSLRSRLGISRSEDLTTRHEARARRAEASS